jgi:Fe-S-cluster containining protein
MNREVKGKFRCTRCGACCRWTGSVLLTDRDIACMAEKLNLTEQAFIDRYTRLAPNRIQLALTERPDGSCCFLSGNRCSIYAARPVQCRSFPHAWRVAEGCPALDETGPEKL